MRSPCLPTRHPPGPPPVCHNKRLIVCVSLVGLLVALATGASERAPRVLRPQPPVIPVSQPVERAVTDYVDFTGRTNAINSVDIRARVSGYLVQMPFKEGAEVKEGDLLFEVDPRPYKAQLIRPKDKSISTRRSSSWPRRTTPGTWTWPRRPAPSACSNSTRTRRRSTRPTPRSRPSRRAWRSTSSISVSPRSPRRSTARSAATF